MVNSIRKLKPSLTVIVLSAVLISILGTASATRINWQYDDLSENYIPPGADDANITQFEIIDGNDRPILNTTFPGDDLHKFRINTTMFLNQSSGSTQGLNGYNKGEDILRVDLVHIEGSKSLLNGSLVGNFSSDLSFADGGYSSDGLFNGDQVAGGNSEAIIVSNTSESDVLKSKDFVVAEGTMNFSNFSDSVQFSDDDGSGSYEGFEALIRNSGKNGFLNSSDTVIRSGNASLLKFNSSKDKPGRVEFVDNNSDGSYTEGNAIIRYSAAKLYIGSNDQILVNGTADTTKAKKVRISYVNNTAGGFQNTDEPIYYEGPDPNRKNIVNVSDVRIGEARISVSGGFSTVENNSKWNSSLSLGKKLYNDTKSLTGYEGNGTFKLLKFRLNEPDFNPLSSCQDLQDIRNDLSSNYILTKDIDCSGFSNFEAIGDSSNPFNGSLDGNGYVISNLTIDEPNQNFTALIGFMNESGNITQLGLRNITISGGEDQVAGLVAENNGTISQAFVTGNISGKNKSVGGIAGDNFGNISESYSLANVTGNVEVGGLVGDNFVNISNSYAAGNVTGSSFVGGLVGNNTVDVSRNFFGSIAESYWDNTTSGTTQATSAGSPVSDGLLTKEMQGENATENMDFDFNDTWSTTLGYPELKWQSTSPGIQEVLLYDPSNDTSTTDTSTNLEAVSGDSEIPDIYVYDSNPSNLNIPNTIQLGERFSDSQARAVKDPDSIISPEVTPAFDGSDQFYNVSEDNVSLRTSGQSVAEPIIVQPGSLTGQTGIEGTLHESGNITFWNASGTSEYGINGFFIDMNENRIVDEGDVRMGGWKKDLPAGNVDKGDVDVGINTSEFDGSSNVKIIQKDGDTEYDPGGGSATGGREAIIISPDSELDSTDEFVRSGFINDLTFDEDTRFTGDRTSKTFTGESAIVENTGSDVSVLEDEDTILKSGRAFMKNLSDEVRYVENGSTPGFEQGSSEAIIYDSGADGNVSRGFLDSSPDRVIAKGSAGLTNFSSPPKSRGETGKVFLDTNNTGRYNQGEDIINVTLVTNGSDSKKINGTKIFNFAESTKHNNQSSYSDGDAIINDTDRNTVYRDALTGLEIENVYDTSGSIREILDSGDIRGGNLELYRQGGEKVTDLTPAGSDPTIWSASSFSERIDSNTTYYVAFDPEESSNLEDKVYGIEAESSDISTAGSDSLTSLDCSRGSNCVQRIVDNHAPEFKASITGSKIDGNSSKRDRIYTEVLEVGAGLSNSFKPQDFNISFPEYNVTKAKFLEGDGDILLTLNDSLETNQTPEVSLVEPDSKKNGVIRDLASNLNGDDSIEPRDGLRPLIQGIEYLDKDIDGSIDGINVSFSERINYTRLDLSGWNTEPKDIDCMQPLTPGDNAYLCPKESDKIDLVSNGASTLFQDSLGLESLSYVNSSVENSSRYEIGRKLYNVTSSNTGYSQDGGFVLHEYSGSDGVLNPDGGPDQDVIVYSINGTALTPGDVLVYNQNPSNSNIPVEPGEEFTEESIDSMVLPEESFNLTSQTGFHGSNPYDPETDNVSVNLSYNSSEFDQPNSSVISLTPVGSQALSPPEPFNPSGNVKFWNLSGNSDRPVQDGLFVDVNMTGNISDGDIRLGRWRLEDKKQLYTHRIEVDVGSQTSGESLNNTLVRTESGSYDSIGPDNIVKAEISNSTRDLNVEGNITEVNLRNGGKALNISFNTSKYDIQLDESDKVSISYYSRLNATSNRLDTAELNSGSDGSTYDGVKQIDRTNRSEVTLNATAVDKVTGGLLEPVFNFTVLQNQISDQSGNTIVNSSSFTLRDSAAPATVSASTKDSDNDARIDRIDIGLSEQIDGSDSNLSKAFEVSKGDVKSVINPASDDEDLRLNVSDVGGTASVPDLKMIKDAIEDSSDNTISENQTFDNVRDLANPLIMNAEIDPVLSNSNFTFVDAEFSENVSGKEEINQSVEINQKKLTFNNTVSTENISINYSEVLQTGRHPNITSTVNLTDKAGNKLENLRQENITVNTFRREMVEGWNFVSFPLTSKSGIRIDEIFDVSRLNAIWSYGENGWSIYDPEAPENDFNTVQGGKGYIVNVSENFTLASNVNNTITNPVQGQELDQYGTNLTNEWNLIGNTQEFNQRPSAEDAFVNVDAEVSPIYGQKYRNGSRTIDLENPVKDSGGTTNERIIVGRAYWAEVPNGENQTYRVPLGG